jgi:phosphate starvation-inducible PhoH-like protein
MTNKNKPSNDDSFSLILEIDNTDTCKQLVGPQDSNVRFVQEELEIKIDQVPSGLKFEGFQSEVELSYDLFSQIKEIIESGQQIFEGDFIRALKMLSRDRHAKLTDVFRDQVSISGRKHSIVPKTNGQRFYLEAIRNNDITFGVGPAGTGKTYLAMAMAMADLTKKRVSRIILCRPAVEAGEKLGFLPGTLSDKVNPYLRPLYDALHEMVDDVKALEMLEKGQIEVAPLAFMRGRTLSNAFVILDEAQNTTAVQMKMILTRLGKGSKCVVTGDPSQIDLPKGIQSGLIEALDILKNVKGVSITYLNEVDVVRHAVVARILEAYGKQNK